MRGWNGKHIEPEKHPKAKRKQQKKETPCGYKTHFHFPVFFPHILYLPTEAREEDLTVLVFVLQLLGNSDEAGAGLRAVSGLQK